MADFDDQASDREALTRDHLARALKRARGSLLWERLWPALATLATALGLFLALSWAGLWMVLPPLGRAAGLVLFGLLIAASAIPLLRLRLPRDAEALRRLDRVSGERHRPATALSGHAPRRAPTTTPDQRDDTAKRPVPLRRTGS